MIIFQKIYLFYLFIIQLFILFQLSLSSEWRTEPIGQGAATRRRDRGAESPLASIRLFKIYLTPSLQTCIKVKFGDMTSSLTQLTLKRSNQFARA